MVKKIYISLFRITILKSSDKSNTLINKKSSIFRDYFFDINKKIIFQKCYPNKNILLFSLGIIKVNAQLMFIKNKTKKSPAFIFYSGDVALTKNFKYLWSPFVVLLLDNKFFYYIFKQVLKKRKKKYLSVSIKSLFLVHHDLLVN